MVKSPGFTAVAVLSLAMGIGANTAIFSVIRSVLLDPLPVERPDELALVYWARPANNNLRFLTLHSSGYQDHLTKRSYNSNYTYAQFQSLQAAAGDAAEIVGFNFVKQITVSVDNQPATAATGFLVSGNHFSAMRLGTILGRPLDARDESAAARVAVISHAFWLRDQSLTRRDLYVRAVKTRERPKEAAVDASAGEPEWFSVSADGVWLRVRGADRSLIRPESSLSSARWPDGPMARWPE